MPKEQILALSIILGVVFVSYVLPLLWVLVSNRTQGGTKFGWFIVVLLFSWLGLAVFLIITKVPNRESTPSTDSSASPQVVPVVRDLRRW